MWYDREVILGQRLSIGRFRGRMALGCPSGVGKLALGTPAQRGE